MMTPLLAPCIERRHGRWELNNFIAFSCALRAPEKKLHGWRLIRTEWLAETAIVLRHRTNIQAIRQDFGRRRAEIAHAMDRDRGDPSVSMSYLDAALSRCEQLVKTAAAAAAACGPSAYLLGQPEGAGWLVPIHRYQDRSGWGTKRLMERYAEKFVEHRSGIPAGELFDPFRKAYFSWSVAPIPAAMEIRILKEVYEYLSWRGGDAPWPPPDLPILTKESL